MTLEIYYDAEQEVNWFTTLSPAFRKSIRKRLLDRGNNDNDLVNQLIIYDRPDIILMVDDEPKLVLEKTEEVPSGHNVGQRIGRLARAVELNVPIIDFFPFLARKHGQYSSKCYVRPNIFLAFNRMTEIHDVPALALNWKCDNDGELIKDGSENREIRNLMVAFEKNNFSFSDLEETSNATKRMELEYVTRCKANKKNRQLPPSVSVENTKSLLSGYGRTNVLDNILKKKESFVYEIGMTPENCRREDPYTGNQFIYDYCYCRTGRKISNRKMNFILNFPNITITRWKDANPENIERKSYLWYVLADIMIFKDGIMTRGDDFG